MYSVETYLRFIPQCFVPCEKWLAYRPVRWSRLPVFLLFAVCREFSRFLETISCQFSYLPSLVIPLTVFSVRILFYVCILYILSLFFTQRFRRTAVFTSTLQAGFLNRHYWASCLPSYLHFHSKQHSKLALIWFIFSSPQGHFLVANMFFEVGV